jgi:hypothetical protein
MSPYTVNAATSRIVVGPHNIVTRNGITFNDRSQLERYEVDDFNGFERPDLLTPAEQNPQEDGETPLPASRGGRTMTMSGNIIAGSYPKLLEMSADLEDSLIDLLELSMVIKVAVSSTYFTQPDIQIACRPTDWTIDKKLVMTDRGGVFRRAFSVALRASTEPRYLAVATKVATLNPASLVFPGGGGGLTFPGGGGGLIFPAVQATAVAANVGNWSALPIIRFIGPIGDITLTNDNGQTLRINGHIAAGAWIEVNTSTSEVKDQTGAFKASFFDSTSDWLQLEGRRGGSSGNNALTLLCNWFDTGAQVTLTYHDSSM